MEIPSSWNSNKRQRASRHRGESSRKKTRWSYESESPVPLEELCTEICQNVLDSKKEQLQDTVSFDTILSSIPYRNILDTLFGGVDVPPSDVPVVAKRFEESFMRECVIQGERKCVLGQDCECRFIDKDNQFVGVEFLVPGQTTSNCTPQMCVLCSRKHTQKLYYDMLFKPPSSYIGAIQRYGVIHNSEGEYSPDYVLVMPPNGPVHAMPYPFPVHCRNNYRVIVRSATRYLVQRPESAFQSPSLSKP